MNGADDEADDVAADAPPETISTYLRLRGMEPSPRRRRRRRRDPEDENLPFTAGRDPRGVADVLADFTKELGWDSQLAQEDVVLGWAGVVGEETARHTEPVAFTEGTLAIRCDSTAWAKQLQLMRSDILSSLMATYPEAGVTAVRFLGPDVPSWKWGIRAVPGRGPRDTYG